jgi:hypothetical protein
MDDMNVKLASRRILSCSPKKNLVALFWIFMTGQVQYFNCGRCRCWHKRRGKMDTAPTRIARRSLPALNRGDRGFGRNNR